MPTPADNADASAALQEIEAVFRKHAAVREVRVVSRRSPGGAPQFACYVVPNALGAEGPPAEEAQVKRWRKVFDLVHTDASAPDDAAITAPRPRWTSSYTRKEFEPAEVDEWLDATLAEVRALRPSRVLELGCGSGVLVSRLAPACSRYVGTDISPRSLEQLAAYLGTVRPRLKQVTLMERPANDFDGFADDDFDVVLLNSVLQYFPNERYLRQVLEGALRVVRPGGAIVLGDVRSLPLLPPLCTSLELFRAPDDLPLHTLSERVARRIGQQQEELLLSPAYFGQPWVQQHPKISWVEVLPKRGRRVNEFSAYRYEVVLHVGAAPQTWLEPTWQTWEPGLDLETLTERLAEPGLEQLALRGVANARVERDVAAWTALQAGAVPDVGALKRSLETHASGLSPEDLHLLAERKGFRAQLSFAQGAEDGRFDAVLERAQTPARPIAWGGPAAGAIHRTSNDPGQSALRHRLIPQLLTHSQQHLRAEWVPTSITLVDTLPPAVAAGPG